MIAAIHARLNTKAVDRVLQTQADRLCSLVKGPVAQPTQDFTDTSIEGLTMDVIYKPGEIFKANAIVRAD